MTGPSLGEVRRESHRASEVSFREHLQPESGLSESGEPVDCHKMRRSGAIGPASVHQNATFCLDGGLARQSCANSNPDLP